VRNAPRSLAESSGLTECALSALQGRYFDTPAILVPLPGMSLNVMRQIVERGYTLSACAGQAAVRPVVYSRSPISSAWRSYCRPVPVV